MSGPLGKISLALSGGGTRAAGYHLGVLSYLDRLGVLTDVAVISGASGGAFITSTYAMSQAKGQSFSQYADWMLTRLRTGKMAEWVLAEFSGGRPMGLSGRRSVIAALAESYDKHFFEGFRFGDLVDRQPGHLEEVVINATDFRSGLGFRFQRHPPAGNAQSPVDPALLRHARLADVMASSSCLPGGMEPFFFPEDFVWEGSGAIRDAGQLRGEFSKLGVEAIPLMDGGLYDNQALEALIEAASRLTPEGETPDGADTAMEDKERVWKSGTETQRYAGEFDLLFQRIASGDIPDEPPGLVLVSDAVRADDPILRAAFAPGDARPLVTLPEAPDTGRRLSAALTAWWVLLVLCGGTVGAVIYHMISVEIATHWQTRLTVGSVLLYVVPLLLAGSAFTALIYARRAARGMLSAVDMILRTEGACPGEKRGSPSTWSFLRQLRLSQLSWLVKIRVASMMALMSDIFFVRHRILGYALLYGFPGWQRQLLSVEIFSLLIKAPADAPQVTDAMRAVATIAANQPTAFWYDQPEELEQLVATGQMSACRNLIVHLRRRRERDPELFGKRLADLLERCEADWETFRERPLDFVPAAARPAPLTQGAV